MRRQRVRLVARPDQAPDPRVGGGEQFAQQVGAEEPGRPGEQDLAGTAPVRPRTRRCRVPPDREVEPGLAGEVDSAGRRRRSACPRGRPRGRGEPAQRGVAQQAAGKRPNRVGAGCRRWPACAPASPRRAASCRRARRNRRRGRRARGCSSLAHRADSPACVGVCRSAVRARRGPRGGLPCASGGASCRARRGPRQVLARDELRRDHVAGQPVEQVAPEARGRRVVRGGPGRRGGTGV